jgi:hypothetical protein
VGRRLVRELNSALRAELKYKDTYMTKNQLLFFRTMLFAAGAGIVLLSFFLLTAGKELIQIDAFMWVSIGILYLVFWTPFFFSHITIGNFSVKIPRLSLVWLGVVLYTVASIVILALLRNRIIAFNAAVIAEAVLLFFFAINIYFAFLASQRVANVAAKEKTKLAPLTGIKNKARITALAVQSLPSQFENEQKILMSTFEEIKYISPVRDAEELELRIISVLNHIQELCDAVQSSGAPSGFDNCVQNLQMLVKQRKLLRN